MSDLPTCVEIREEGPREGFQIEPPGIPVADKLRLIDALAATGLGRIACASFVDPRRVPQMADSAEIARSIRRRPGVAYSAMWLNEQGFAQALASGLDVFANVVASASETFSVRNNGCDAAGLARRQARLLERYREAGVALDAAHLFTAFGCHFEGPTSVARCVAAVDALLALCDAHGVAPRTLVLCDTIGAANPEQLRRTLAEVRSRWPRQPIGLHLHDTRGMGLANALVGLQLGVRVFDASIGGLGGCPFAGHRGASGNVATEDLALMCEEMGVRTGLDLDALLDAARLAESIVGHPLPGRAMRVGRLARPG